MGWAIRTCAIVMCLMVGRGHASSASGETGASAPGGPALLDRIRVVVNGQPITQNQIEFYRAYLTMMDGGGLGRPRPVPDMEQLSSSELLELVIVDELLFEAASRVEAMHVRESELNARIEQFRQSFDQSVDYEAFARNYELTSDVLREFFSRRERVARYIELKVGAARPTDMELRAYYVKHFADVTGMPFEQVREQISSRLYAARAAERFEQWTEELKARSSVVVPGRAPAR